MLKRAIAAFVLILTLIPTVGSTEPMPMTCAGFTFPEGTPRTCVLPFIEDFRIDCRVAIGRPTCNATATMGATGSTPAGEGGFVYVTMFQRAGQAIPIAVAGLPGTYYLVIPTRDPSIPFHSATQSWQGTGPSTYQRSVATAWVQGPVNGCLTYQATLQVRAQTIITRATPDAWARDRVTSTLRRSFCVPKK